MGDVDSPGLEVVSTALRTVFERHLARCAQDRRYAGLTAAALRERVVAIAGQPARRGPWWAVGRISDDVAGEEWTVWIEPDRRVARLILGRPVPPAIPEPLRHADGRFYDGMRRRWVLPDGSLVPDESGAGQEA